MGKEKVKAKQLSLLNSAVQFICEKHDGETASSYGEPGYSDPSAGIIVFANWNNLPDGLFKWLEKCGVECEWSDEWTQVNDKAYRTSPDSYHWECQLMLTADGEYLTPEDPASEWILECAVDSIHQPLNVLPSRITNSDLEEAGYVLLESECETGFHPGQNDNPKEILSAALKAGSESVVFRKVENSQFYSRWEAWHIPKENDEQA